MGEVAASLRVLVTGFEAFGGEVVNPTAWLMGALDDCGRLPAGAAFRFVTLPVDYDAVGGALECAGDGFDPQMVVLFGLGRSAGGFRLERKARNAFSSPHADNRGHTREAGEIVCGGGDIASSLPLGRIARRLAREGLPVEWSDDAGGYLCNLAFFSTVSSELCPMIRPERAGFIHVPRFAEDDRGAAGGDGGLTREQLLAGALSILSECVGAMRTEGGAQPSDLSFSKA